MTPSDSGGPRIGGTIGGDLQPCWLCGRSVAARALFCHACGAVQAPRALDHFARLGLERRFDVDPEQLARQRNGLARALEPQRFATRGVRQQTLARQQADALTAAFEALRDPVRRARYLLDLAGEPVPDDCADDAEVAGLAAALAGAADCGAVDRVGADAVNRIASGIKDLATAFREHDTARAARIVARLEALESLAAEARARRPSLKPAPP